MNKQRREKIEEARKLIEEATSKYNDAKGILEECRDEEQDAYDNLPQSLQSSERGETMEQNVEYLEEAISALENIE